MSTQNACKVKTCPALSSSNTTGYCPIHYKVASTPELFAQALSGKLTAEMKQFAEEVQRGYYPKAGSLW